MKFAYSAIEMEKKTWWKALKSIAKIRGGSENHILKEK
jgi:hypothetical protein